MGFLPVFSSLALFAHALANAGDPIDPKLAKYLRDQAEKDPRQYASLIKKGALTIYPDLPVEELYLRHLSPDGSKFFKLEENKNHPSGAKLVLRILGLPNGELIKEIPLPKLPYDPALIPDLWHGTNVLNSIPISFSRDGKEIHVGAPFTTRPQYSTIYSYGLESSQMSTTDLGSQYDMRSSGIVIQAVKDSQGEEIKTIVHDLDRKKKFELPPTAFFGDSHDLPLLLGSQIVPSGTAAVGDFVILNLETGQISEKIPAVSPQGRPRSISNWIQEFPILYSSATKEVFVLDRTSGKLKNTIDAKKIPSIDGSFKLKAISPDGDHLLFGPETEYGVKDSGEGHWLRLSDGVVMDRAFHVKNPLFLKKKYARIDEDHFLLTARGRTNALEISASGQTGEELRTSLFRPDFERDLESGKITADRENIHEILAGHVIAEIDSHRREHVKNIPIKDPKLAAARDALCKVMDRKMTKDIAPVLSFVKDPELLERIFENFYGTDAFSQVELDANGLRNILAYCKDKLSIAAEREILFSLISASETFQKKADRKAVTELLEYLKKADLNEKSLRWDERHLGRKPSSIDLVRFMAVNGLSVPENQSLADAVKSLLRRKEKLTKEPWLITAADLKLFQGKLLKDLVPLLKTREARAADKFKPTLDEIRESVAKVLVQTSAGPEDFEAAAWMLSRNPEALSPEVIEKFNIPNLAEEVDQMIEIDPMLYRGQADLAAIKLGKRLIELLREVKSCDDPEHSRFAKIKDWFSVYSNDQSADPLMYSGISRQVLETAKKSLCPTDKTDLLRMLIDLRARNSSVQYDAICGVQSALLNEDLGKTSRPFADILTILRTTGVSATETWNEPLFFEELRAFGAMAEVSNEVLAGLVRHSLGGPAGVVSANDSERKISIPAADGKKGLLAKTCRLPKAEATQRFLKALKDRLDQPAPVPLGFTNEGGIPTVKELLSRPGFENDREVVENGCPAKARVMTQPPKKSPSPTKTPDFDPRGRARKQL